MHAIAPQSVRLKDPSAAPESPEEARRPCTTAGIWHFMYDADLKIADVWFLRELSADESYRKARNLPDPYLPTSTAAKRMVTW